MAPSALGAPRSSALDSAAGGGDSSLAQRAHTHNTNTNMYGNGYVGSAADSTRIRRQEKEREEQRRQFEEGKNKVEAKVAAAGLKQFGASRAEAYEAAFKTAWGV